MFRQLGKDEIVIARLAQRFDHPLPVLDKVVGNAIGFDLKLGGGGQNQIGILGIDCWEAIDHYQEIQCCQRAPPEIGIRPRSGERRTANNHGAQRIGFALQNRFGVERSVTFFAHFVIDRIFFCPNRWAYPCGWLGQQAVELEAVGHFEDLAPRHVEMAGQRL